MKKLALRTHPLSLTVLTLSLLGTAIQVHAESRWFLDMDLGIANFTDKPDAEHWDLNVIGKTGVGGLSFGKQFPTSDGHTWQAFLHMENHHAAAERTMWGLNEGSEIQTSLFGIGTSYQHSLNPSWYLSGLAGAGWYSSELEVYNRQNGVKTSMNFDSKGNYATLGLGVGYRFNDNWHGELGFRKQYLSGNEFHDQLGDSVRYSHANQTLLNIGYKF